MIWCWLTPAIVRALHLEAVAQFGGAAKVRDAALLESALDRPRNLAAYGQPTVYELAAAYCFGIIRNHPFVDGNKRTGLLAAHAFLALNGYDFRPLETEIVAMIAGAAAGRIDEATLARWITDTTVRRPA